MAGPKFQFLYKRAVELAGAGVAISPLQSWSVGAFTRSSLRRFQSVTVWTKKLNLFPEKWHRDSMDFDLMMRNFPAPQVSDFFFQISSHAWNTFFFLSLFNICSPLPKYHKEIIQTVSVLENVTPMNTPHAHVNVFAYTQMNIPHGHVFPYTYMQTYHLHTFTCLPIHTYVTCLPIQTLWFTQSDLKHHGLMWETRNIFAVTWTLLVVEA